MLIISVIALSVLSGNTTKMEGKQQIMRRRISQDYGDDSGIQPAVIIAADMKNNKNDYRMCRRIEIIAIIILGLITILVVVFNGPIHTSESNGSIVELYEPDSYFAVPAIIIDEIITSSSSSSNSTASNNKVYTIQNAITNNQITDIPSEYIHPYTPYKDGTIASCNISKLRNVKSMKPCAIISHSIHDNKEHKLKRSSRSNGLVIYQVSYLNENEKEELIYDNLPFSRVQRRRHIEDEEK